MLSFKKHTTKIIKALVFSLFLLTILNCDDPTHSPSPLERAVDLNMVKLHQFMLQKIAGQNDNNRFPGTPGFDKSAQYIVAWLKSAGYKPVIQEFDFTIFKEASDPVFNQVAPNSVIYPPKVPEGFITTSYSGGGNITAVVQPVDLIIPIGPNNPPNTSTSGCEPDDFAGFTPGNIALLQRGECSNYNKAANAQAAGACGVIIMNEGQPYRTDAIRASLGKPNFTIPVVFANYNIGVELYNSIQNGMTVRINLKVDAVFEEQKTCNIIADTPGGDDNHTVVTGAHLDSSESGPGINDDGSGSAALLEIAGKIGLLHIKPRHKIRFAFWSAEEEGMLGSEYYVAHLAPEELARISMYLNLDMIASSNYVRFVYDGDGSDSTHPGPLGSEKIEKLFNDYFAARGLPTDPAAITGSSDYGSFAARNIPVGGVYSGSSEIKTEEQAGKYGGAVDEPCDPNYHTPNDTVANLNYTIEEQMLKAIAYSIFTYGTTLLDAQENLKRRSTNIYRATFKGPLAIQ